MLTTIAQTPTKTRLEKNLSVIALLLAPLTRAQQMQEPLRESERLVDTWLKIFVTAHNQR